jgi:5'-nucleotidase
MRTITFVSLVITASALLPMPLEAQDADWPRSILFTNDDGIAAEGLLALVREFAPNVDTYVIAPLDNRSGSTNYISAIAKRTIEVEPRDLGAGITAYAVDGYPADAIVFALRGLLADDPPDLVISGVNTGPNLTGDWNLSGTVGAAQMAAFLGVPAIAVSGYSPEHPETLAAIGRWLVELARSRLVRGLSPGQYLTVSVPRVPVSDITGVEIVRRGPRPWRIELAPSGESPSLPGRELWSLRFAERAAAPLTGTDLQAYEANRIAIVPMRAVEDDFESLRRLADQPPDTPPWPPAGQR